MRNENAAPETPAAPLLSSADRLAVELNKAVSSISCYRRIEDIGHLSEVKAILAAPQDVQAAFVHLTSQKLAAIPEILGKPQEGWDGRYHNLRGMECYPTAESIVCERLLRRSLPFSDQDLESVVRNIATVGIVTTSNVRFIDKIVRLIEVRFQSGSVPTSIVEATTRLSKAINCITNAPEQKLVRRLSRLSREPCRLPIHLGEAWSDAAIKTITAMSEPERTNWHELISVCSACAGGSPGSKWVEQANARISAISFEPFKLELLRWMELVDQPRTQELTDWNREDQPDPNQLIIEPHANILKGLVWCGGLREDKEVARALTALALSCYRKIPLKGPREVKVGNACVTALGMMPGMEGVGQLALLKVRVKFGTAQKMIEKALEATAQRVGLRREELEEMAVPAYGLTEVGRCTENFGDFTAELIVTGSDSTSIAWFKSDGKRQQSVPAIVKEKFAAELQELRMAAKDIQRMLPAQRERIDNLFREQKSWPFAVWRERYLDHPLVGMLARRLIWEFTIGGQTTAAIFFKGALVDLDLKPLKKLDDSTKVQLWHPIGKDADEIVAWRAWLDAQRIQQPFKQAHREVYLLTDAERQTRTYSNRFAAHIIRQHQFNALCAARGWKNKLRLMVDDEYPPAAVRLPKWGLRAEFWIKGVGEEYGVDTNDSGVFLRLTTDQVRFYRLNAAQRTAHAGGGGYHADQEQNDEPLPLAEIPPLVFSEVMRDVDLFVGVASVGNDPTWSDGGPEGRYRDYWQSYSFGELNASAKTRKDVLQRLVPRLKIAGQCSFEEKFLVVKGSVRSYKIHLGSGNILMAPNDQYLCIVPKQGAAEDGKVLLPFEGDRTLSVILSKAFLLANDAMIKDPSVVSQIKRN